MCAEEAFTRLEQSAAAMVDFIEYNYHVKHQGEGADHKERVTMFTNRLDLSWVTNMLANLEGSGYGYAVFTSKKCAEAVHDFIIHQNEGVDVKANWVIRMLTGRHLKRTFEGSLVEEQEGAQTSKGHVFSITKNRHTEDFYPVTVQLRANPESIAWQNFGIQFGEVMARMEEIPGRILLSILITLLFFLPNLLFFSKNARLGVGMKDDVMWVAKTKVLAAIYASSYNVVVSTAIKCANSMSAIIRDGEDLIALLLVILSLGTLTSVNVTFTLGTLVPAYVDHMAILGQRPTLTDATASTLFRLIFPSLIAIRYFVEPIMKYFVPRIGKAYVLPRLPNFRKSPGELERMLKWPEINPVWPYADLIVNTSLCSTMFFYITPYASKIMMLFAMVLIFRYFWLAYAWTSFSTNRRIGTSKLYVIALYLWSIPTGFLAAAAAFWYVRNEEALKLAPLGLPNGPAQWDPDSYSKLIWTTILVGLGHVVSYMGLITVGIKLGSCCELHGPDHCRHKAWANYM
eukprot:gnl/TRDRNA2_/TRDRNA2_152539_c0_seq1.p1 gnl/TRDRNA2_/TRDRNA2_152539_c0~~gnl/TRDRNA2_/TRDRNA2_152539_c0_seq1.p1  ORF type:complete len:537 (+),score=61.16 gnl/TRDRNA2_/TRDRNA2_152539_c0_seq1:68-1612(+)